MNYKKILHEAKKEQLMDIAIKQYGESKVRQALYALFRWTRGDVFKTSPKIFEPLSIFKPATLPSILYKGIRHNLLPEKFQDDPGSYWYGWSSDGKVNIGKKNAISFMNKFLVNHLTSWTINPSVAAKFASANAVLMLKNPSKNEIFIDVDMIPLSYRFSGSLQTSGGLMMMDRIEVPTNEKEIIVKINQSSLKKIHIQEVYFSSGKYLGDYEVDTLGLTKRKVTWHVSPM